MQITLAQINPIIGNLNYNFEKIVEVLDEKISGLIVFPELVMTGYPPRDLLLQKSFNLNAMDILHQLAKRVKEQYAIIGTPWYDDDRLYNAAVVLHQGEVMAKVYKTLLPDFDVFDEERYFYHLEWDSKVLQKNIIEIEGKRIWISICEDIWADHSFPNKSKIKWLPNWMESVKEEIDLMINLSASPYTAEKEQERQQMVKKTIRQIGKPLVYLNQVGANDELIFDGGSFVMNSDLSIPTQLKKFEEDIKTIDDVFDNVIGDNEIDTTHQGCVEADWFSALVLGVKDYFVKSGFSKAVIGLSGGIDSALVAVIATKALGSENLSTIALPTKFNSPESLLDAMKLAKNLNLLLRVLPMEASLKVFRESFQENTNLNLEGLAAENFQARMRANYLMTFSNQTDSLLLATGNKSELAVGYSTLYGDLCGSLLVIGDLFKTEVYSMAEWINTHSGELFGMEGGVIPENIITKPPTAELRENQQDSDSLPDYGILDSVLKKILLEGMEKNELISLGWEESLVERVGQLVKNSEYKRFQAPLVLKLSPKSFGSGRRIPIVK